MKVQIFTLLAITITSTAMADFKLANNGKTVTCFGADNTTITLNAKRTAMKVSTEGESLGFKKITKTTSDNSTYTKYKGYEGVLILSSKGDTYLNAGASKEDTDQLDCK